MQDWLASYGPRFVWPAMFVVGAIVVVAIWMLARIMYVHLSATTCGAIFMLLGFGLLLYCAYTLISVDPLGNGTLFWNGIGVMAGFGALAAGALGLRNSSDF